MQIKSMVKNKLSQHHLTKQVFTIMLLVTMLVITSDSGVAMTFEQTSGPTYIIKDGDTLYEIAIWFGLSAEEIQEANGIDDPNLLSIGQAIIIPGLEGITGVLTSEVLPFGTSLTNISRQYHLNQSDLMTLNRITSPSEMVAGVSFIIPVNEKQNQLNSIPALIPGDTLLETAIRAGISPWMLIEDNQLNATWDVLPGESIFVNQDFAISESIASEFIAISVNQLPLVQGETLQITVESQAPVEISGSFNGAPLHFFMDGETEYTSFHGIHTMAEPGVFPLEVVISDKDGKKWIFDQPVLLTPGYYASEYVTISEVIYLNKEKIAEEDAYLQQFWDQITTERYWEGRFQYPIDEPCPNSPFGQRRDYNDGLLFYYHTGLDFVVCAQNKNIYAPAAGYVIVAEELFTKGNGIYIDHGWGVISGFAHLEEILVEVGQFVEPGDLIGIIGDTGRSAGPHLHFEIIVSGTPVNPQTWLDQTFP